MAKEKELQCGDCGETFTSKKAYYCDGCDEGYECPSCGGTDLIDTETGDKFTGEDD